MITTPPGIFTGLVIICKKAERAAKIPKNSKCVGPDKLLCKIYIHSEWSNLVFLRILVSELFCLAFNITFFNCLTTDEKF